MASNLTDGHPEILHKAQQVDMRDWLTYWLAATWLARPEVFLAAIAGGMTFIVALLDSPPDVFSFVKLFAFFWFFKGGLLLAGVVFPCRTRIQFRC